MDLQFRVQGCIFGVFVVAKFFSCMWGREQAFLLVVVVVVVVFVVVVVVVSNPKRS